MAAERRVQLSLAVARHDERVSPNRPEPAQQSDDLSDSKIAGCRGRDLIRDHPGGQAAIVSDATPGDSFTLVLASEQLDHRSLRH